MGHPGQPANLITQLMSGATSYPMSRGYESAAVFFQPDHWLQAAIGGSYIGLLDPFLVPGPIPMFASPVAPWSSDYMFPSDVRALDRVGWDINDFDLQTYFWIPISAVPMAPIQHAITSTTQPVLAWSGSTAYSYRADVFRGESTDDRCRVASLNAGSALAVSVPAGVLLANETYSWVVIAFSGTEWSHSEPAVFRTVSLCDIDFNNDDVFPDTTDAFEFLGVFAGGPCSNSCCDSIDFNGDGVSPDTSDITAFLDALSGGC